MKSIKAKKGSFGYAYGRAYVIDKDINITKQNVTDIDSELKRLDAAVKNVDSNLKKAKSNADEETAPIIDAQIAMLYDKSFLEEVRRMINDEAVCGEYAVSEIGRSLAEQFEEMDNSYLNVRSADIRGISERLCRQLMGKDEEIIPDTPSVVCAYELTPELVSTIDKTNIKAFVSQKGTKTSHVSILCGNYGIPYLFGVDLFGEGIETGVELAVDTEKATLYIEPTDEIKKRIDESATQKCMQEEADLGDSVKICANIGSVKEAEAAAEAGADGIGLFRTEFLYMGAQLPTEEEQFEVYKAVATAMSGKTVIIRTMDIGADKKSPCVKLSPQDNPALGKRAIRICLEERDLFKNQLRAILRAANYGDVKIMYPMITSVAEIERINEILQEAINELEAENVAYSVPSQGVMIETPSAALLSDQLAAKVDFFSIGTNDLTQYTLAVDRMAEELDDYFDTHSEAVMRLIKMVVKNAHAAGIWVGICGELGGDEWAVPRLLEMGIDELSVSPSKINRVKALVADVMKSDTQDEAKLGTEIMCAPADGKVIRMSEIPDPAFSGGMLGKCMGIIPDNGNVYAPCDGEVYMIAETKHAIGIMSDYGNDVLIHVGIDTVSLGGKGFDVLVSENDRVTKGMLIMKIDRDVIRAANLSDMIITVVKEK
ncbi:MAG: phosphoenolpyruvate--protein phosphotransferase [Lachnospiraceae bacterium]|nr:phosphoenolpyruvate--protein phosphotransferase [Candidatus Colinaster equi]